MGQKLTHDDSGIPVPLDNILDPVVALPTGNKSQNAEPDCAAGSSLTELDLCLSPAQAAMFDSGSGKHGGRRRRRESVNGFTLWNHGVIPYVFNSTFSPAERDAILGAMSEWQKSTCIRFRQAAEGDVDLVVFKDGIRCSTNIGRIGNEQTVTLADNCRTKRILIHELGHVIGLIHEHQRHDRDKYVKVIYENVRNVSQERYQFSKLLTESLTERAVNYDYTSIMHYGRNYFAKSPELTTLQPTDSQYLDIIGRAERPSFSDSETVNKLYHCSASCPPTLRCGDSCFMDGLCVCRCRPNTDHSFYNDPNLHGNNLLDSTCEFFARRGDCGSSMEDTIGRLCSQYCRLYQLPEAVTSTQSPASTKKPQAKLMTALWSSNPNLQPPEKRNDSSNHSVLKNVQNRSLVGTLLPVNTRLSTRPRHHSRRVQQSQRYSPHSSVTVMTFPQVMQRNTSSLFLNRNIRRQQLQMQNNTHDISLHQRHILNSSTKTRPRNLTRAQIGTTKGQPKGHNDNKTFRRFLTMNTTRVPSVHLESLRHSNHISQRVIPYGTHGLSRLSNSQQQHHREIQQPFPSNRQSIEAPYSINSFMEFVIARQPSISQENAGTKNGNKVTNLHKSGRADFLISNFAINCQSSNCNPNPWKRTNQLSSNVSTTGETDKLNRHLVLTDLIGPEFGLTVNLRPSNVDIKTDTVLTSDHSMQASSPYMIKNDITSQSLANRDSSPRYSVEPGVSVPWGTPWQDLTQSSSGQTVENHEPLHVSQSIDSFATNIELVPQLLNP
ncbi:hypothetical protein BsWGS_09703 [Bradybaena similaris]